MTYKLSPAQIRLLVLIKNTALRPGSFHKRALRKHYRITTWQAVMRLKLARIDTRHLRPLPWLPQPLGPVSYPVLTEAGHLALQQALPR